MLQLLFDFFFEVFSYSFLDVANMTQTTVAGPSTAPERQLMPGSFNPGDYIDFHDNPFETLADSQGPWQSKESTAPWSSEKLPELDLEGVEWFNYAPPAALSNAPNVASEILQTLVKESIETVRATAEEEKRRKVEAAEEEKRRASTEEGSKPGQGEEPYLPIIIPVEKPIEKPLPTPPPSESEIAVSENRSSDDLSQRRAEAVKVVSRSKSPGRSSIGMSSEKSKKINIRRILGWTNEKDSGNGHHKTSRAAFARKLLAGSDSPHANYVFSVYPQEAKSKDVSGELGLKTELEEQKAPEPEPKLWPKPVETV